MRDEEYHEDRGTLSRRPARPAAWMETKSTAWDASRKDAIPLNLEQAPQSAS